MRRSLLLCALACLAYGNPTFHQALCAENRATWNGADNYADWDEPANWEEGFAPNDAGETGYDVQIGRPDFRHPTLAVIRANTSISSLALNGRILLGTEPGVELRVKNNFVFSGGALEGNWGVYRILGDAEFSTSDAKGLGMDELHLYGNTRWTGGNLVFALYGYVVNHPGAVFTITTRGYVGSTNTTASAQVFNEGTIRLDSIGSVSRWYTPITNAGTSVFEIAAGSLMFENAFDGSALLRIETNGTLALKRGGTLGELRCDNRGVLNLAGGVFTFAKDVHLDGTTLLSGWIDGEGSITVNRLLCDGGILNGNGALIVAPGGTMDATPNGAGLSRPLRNEGTVHIRQGTSTGGPRLIVTNAASASLRFEAGTSLGAGHLLNEGSIVKDRTEGIAYLTALTLDNPGTLRVEGGTLSITGNLNGGSVDIPSEGRLNILGDTANLAAHGSGHLRCGGTLSAVIDPSLQVELGGVTLVGPPSSYSFRHLQVLGSISGGPGMTIEVKDSLLWNMGGLFNATLVCPGTARFETGDSEVTIAEGAVVRLGGNTLWQSGGVSVQDGGQLANDGTFLVGTNATLQVDYHGVFENRGSWISMNNATGLVMLVQPTTSSLRSVGNTPAFPPLPGGFGFQGNVSLASNRVSATDARLHLSRLHMVSGIMELTNSTLECTEIASVTNAAFRFDNGLLSLPASGLTGTSSMQGQGRITGTITTSQLSLLPGSRNGLELSGSLSISNVSTAALNITVDLGQPGIIAPGFRIHGPADLHGRLNLNLTTTTNSSFLPLLEPIVVMEADTPITGDFSNAKSGALAPTTNTNVQFRAYYGIGSPYGANRLVITDLGSGFDRWLASRFTPSDLSRPDVSGPLADPDGNGMGNLAEYVFSVDGGVGGPTVLPVAELGYCLINVRLRKGNERFKPTIGISKDLRTWTDITPGTQTALIRLHRTYELPDAWNYWYRVTGIPTSMFLRTKVVMP